MAQSVGLTIALITTFAALAPLPIGAYPFGTPSYYLVGTNPHSVVVRDVNGDGRGDLLTANTGTNDMSVLLGTAAGTLAPATAWAVGSRPKYATTGDFNGDGRVDAVTANEMSSDVSILLGNGDGTFQRAVPYPVCGRPHEVQVGEFNGDGNPDLAVPCYDANVVTVVLGAGNGAFGPAVHHPAGNSPLSVAIADLNADSRQDIAVANQGSGTVSLLNGNGDGTFRGSIDHPTGAGPHEVRVGDLNGDGRPDLVTANQGTHDVSVLLGTTTGSLAPKRDYAAGNETVSLAIGDFDQDGRQDVATADSGGYPLPTSSTSVSVLLGNGDGTLRAPVKYAGGEHPFSISAGNLDSDPQPDLAIANYNAGNNVAVLVNLPSTPPPPPPPPPTGTTYLSDLTATSSSNGWGPVERDTSNGEDAAGDGRPITLNGVVYAKGLGVHANSDVRYHLGGKCSTVVADVGVDDEVATYGSVVFQLWGDSSLLQQSAVMSGSSPTTSISASVEGRNEVALVVTDAGDGNTLDHADWASARVTCDDTSGGADSTPPEIRDVRATDITRRSAVISWTTSENATSQVEFGTTPAYGQVTTLDPALVTAHSQKLTGLRRSTLYHYRVRSTDSSGNVGVSPGSTFTTK